VGKFIKQAFLSQSQYNRLVNKADRIERELMELLIDLKDVLSSLSLNIAEEHIPQSDDEQIGADNPPDSLMPLDGDRHLPKSEYLWQGVMSDWKVK
jgi:hypothetical protein